MKNYLGLLFVLIQFNCVGQGENNTWYFGYNCGLDFNSGSPVALTNGQLNQWEGVASISDSAGNILFYTDGMTVWNRNHLIMPNGIGLFGDNSSTHSATIVRIPGSASQYYIFTCPAFGTFCYSTVDMTLDGGMGDIVIINAPLHLQSSEKCTAIYKQGTSDVWVMGHNTDTVFYSYLVTSSAVNAPVQSYHSAPPCLYSVGYIKASPCGDKIASALYCSSSSDFALYDFDFNIGIVSNEIRISIGNPDGIYSLEFSPDGTKLYAIPWMLSGGTIIYQYDITLGSAAAIAASKDSIGYISYPAVGAAQIGPDQKIYISINGRDSLAVIDNPNLSGPSCGLIENAVYLGGNNSGIGLPSSIRGGTCGIPQAIFTAPNHICPGTCTDFTNLSINATSYLWTFAGANPGTSTDINPSQICYNTPGTYGVTLIATNALGSDTLMLNNFITVYPSPPPQGISQSGDTLFAIAGANSYQWYYNGTIINGATDYFHVALAGGDYNVVATDGNGCEVEAAIFNVLASVQFDVSGLILEVYPNPVGESLFVNSYLFSGVTVEISVYSVIGEIVWKGNQDVKTMIQDVTVDASGLKPGLYWVEIYAGEKNYRTKFIKL